MGSTEEHASPAVASTSAASMGAGLQVEHLPPLQLRARFPPTYPEDQPPDASLFASWLSAAQLAKLKQGISHVWEDQGPGMPILFAWADWLKTSALDHLGASSALAVEAAMPGQLPKPDGEGDVLLDLLRFNAGRMHQHFMQV